MLQEIDVPSYVTRFVAINFAEVENDPATATYRAILHRVPPLLKFETGLISSRGGFRSTRLSILPLTQPSHTWLYSILWHFYLFYIPAEIRKLFCICDKVAQFQCSACYRRGYCGRDCQVRDWDEHKKECVQDPVSAVWSDSNVRHSWAHGLTKWRQGNAHYVFCFTKLFHECVFSILILRKVIFKKGLIISTFLFSFWCVYYFINCVKST